jgi:hypothetical protein
VFLLLLLLLLILSLLQLLQCSMRRCALKTCCSSCCNLLLQPLCGLSPAVFDDQGSSSKHLPILLRGQWLLRCSLHLSGFWTAERSSKGR